MQKPMPEDFDTLYHQFKPRVYRLCMGFVNDRDIAADLLQEIFLKVWENLPRFRNEASHSTWIYRIATNTCLRHLERDSRMPRGPVPDLPDASDSAETEQRIAHLYRSISALEESDRLLISMVLENMPYPEIAAIIGISEGNLRVKIHRAKQRLSTIFAQHEHA